MKTQDLVNQIVQIMALQMKHGPDAASNSENMAELHQRELDGENVPTPEQIRQMAVAAVVA